MSRENVEIVRLMWEAYNDRGVDAALDTTRRTAFVGRSGPPPDPPTFQARKGRGRGNDAHESRRSR